MMSPALEIRSSWRRMRRLPSASIAAIATLAVAVGASVAMFAIIDALWLRPLRFADPGRLVTLWDTEASGERSNMGWQTFADLRERSRTLAGAAALSFWAPTWIAAEGDAERLQGTRVSADFFSLLGVTPAAGRFFTPEEAVLGAHRVAVVSQSLWSRRFGADPGVVGKTIRLDGYEYRVVGVLPPDFDDVFGVDGGPPTEIWAPLFYNASLPYACRTCRHLRVVARVRPEVDLVTARREIDAVGREIAAAAPHEYAAPGVHVVPLAAQVLAPLRPIVTGLAVAVVLLCAMAIANLAGLGLAGAVARDAEFAVRGALGARAAQLFRLPLLEAVLPALLGGGLGVLLAGWILRLARWLAPAYLPRFDAVAITGREVLGAALLGFLLSWLGSAAAALHGLAVARRAWVAADTSSRHSAGKTRRRLLALIVAADVAIGFVLLAGAGLMGRSLLRLLGEAPGFRSEKLLTMELTITGDAAQDAASLAAFDARSLERLRALPGVTSVAFSSQLPLAGNFDRYGVHPDIGGNANPELDPGGDRYSVSDGYLDTMGIPLLAGRFFGPGDRAGSAPVVALSAALAGRLFPGGALERRVKIGGTDGPWRTVVGVVGDVRHQSLAAVSPGAIYLPLTQFGEDSFLEIAVRSAGDPAALAGAVRGALREVSPDIGISDVATYEALTARSAAARRFSAVLLGGFAAVALCLVVVGVYGVAALAAGERRRELGIRRALGATYAHLGRALLGGLGLLTLGGLAAGVAGTLVFGRALGSQLYGVAPADPGTLGLASLALLVAALAAAAGPAIRAARVDPAETLREG